MPTRIPIYAKVLMLFTINALLIGLVGVVAIRQQLSEDLDTVLGRQVSERLTEIGLQIRTEVHNVQLSTWDEVLADFGSEHDVDFYLFSPEGEQVAGKPVSLPSQVAKRLKRSADESMRQPPDRPPPDRPRREGRPGELDRPSRDGQPRGAPPDRKPRPPIERNFFVRSQQPPGFWFGSRMPVYGPDQGTRAPGILLARTSGLFGTGVLIDLNPWFLLAGGVFVISAILWFPLVRDLTASVKQMTSATEKIADGDFDVVVNDRRRDELGRLGTAINQMTGRLSGFVEGQKRFLGDTAHELCAPIARMQMALGILEHRADEKSQDYVRDVHEELQHMSELVNELMSLSKAGLAQKTIKLRPVDLKSSVENIAVRETKGACPVDIAIPENLSVLADPDLLGRAISNVVRNSIRYGGENNRITIHTQSVADQVTLSIEDTGPGVPEDDLPKLFDPFYRVDKVRTPGEGGTGLGLSIVNTCVTACNGTITVENVSPHGLRLNLNFYSGDSSNAQT